MEKIDPISRSVKKIIPLDYPLPIKNTEGVIEGQVYQVEVGRLKVSDLKILPAAFLNGQGNNMTPQEARMVIMALTKLPESTCDEIDLVDAMKIIAECKELFL